MTKETFERLKSELEELNKRISKLDQFLEKERECRFLPLYEFNLMKKQKQYMEGYSNILTARINLHSDNNFEE